MEEKARRYMLQSSILIGIAIGFIIARYIYHEPKQANCNTHIDGVFSKYKLIQIEDSTLTFK